MLRRESEPRAFLFAGYNCRTHIRERLKMDDKAIREAASSFDEWSMREGFTRGIQWYQDIKLRSLLLEVIKIAREGFLPQVKEGEYNCWNGEPSDEECIAELKRRHGIK